MVDAAARASSARATRWRLAIAVLVLGGLYVVGRFTSLGAYLQPEVIRGAVERAGVLGFALYIVLFSVGLLVYIPGILFVAAACLAYGKLVGGALAYVGAVVAVSVSFLTVRSVGGQALTAIERPWVKRMLARLDSRPITTIAVLRLVLAMAPYVNYALALSNVRFRDYLLGSAIGLAGPIAVMTIALDWFLG